DEAIDRGAAGIIAMLPVESAAVPVIQVADTLVALGEIAGGYHRRFSTRVIGITGSTGKTTVKEMVASIMSLSGPTLKTQKNFNNLIGVPMRLLDLKPEHAYAVIEMGTNSPGEIARLTAMADPEVSVLTNITPSHLNGLGTIEGVIAEKQSIFAGTTRAAVFNPRAPYMDAVQIPKRLTTVTFCLESPADVYPVEIRSSGLGGTDVVIGLQGRQQRVHIALPGMHNVLNALAAAATALAVDIAPDTIASGIEAATFPGMRSEIIVSEGLTIIDDSYNANPASMKAALDMLAAAPHENKIAVLGDMLELGQESERFHAQLGVWAAQTRIDHLVVTGAFAPVVAEAAIAAGMDGKSISIAPALEDIQAALDQLLTNETIVLVKASRGLKLDRVVGYLKAVA
ncbi:MAG TPA: UDP-N-acetylmuramoyl-tripeptide--D-alanyl-D-alanine ligase, partial [Deltaproteobacteria bacterium]|nr:UDP-N-acetylmuramoyl-tripeptide--D-alanyl-D-alanine ligase [Deltaproteobacteria bacterium]